MGTTNPGRVALSQFSGTNQFTNLVPESWVKELLRHFDANFVFKQLVNFKYEKTIKGKGDTIHIRKVGRPSIKTYQRNMTTAAEDMTSEKITFTIDQQKYFRLDIDDLDVADMDIDILNECITQAGIALAQYVDEYIEGLFVAGADKDNGVGTNATPIALTPDNIYATFVEWNQILIDTNTVPTGKNPSVVAPTKLVACMRLCDEVKAKSTSLGDRTVREGDTLGTFGGFDVIQSRRVAPDSNGVYNIVAVTSNEALTFAMKVSKLERNRMGSAGKFAQNVMALYFFGGKVIYPEMIGLLTCTIAYA